MGAFTGTLIVVTRIPDIVVTLAMLFVWGGVALLILEIPGGGAPQGFLDLGLGTTGTTWLPTPFLILAAAYVLIWLPLRRRPAGTRPLRGRLQAQRRLPQRRQRRPGARQRVRARAVPSPPWPGSP